MKKITKSTIIAGSVFIVQMIAPQIVDGEVQAKNNKIEVKRGYQNNLYYVDGKLANWWYDDGRDWYFFKDGKKLTGYGKDNSGTKYFVNGKYATGVYGGKTYKEGLEVNRGITRGYHNNLYYVNGKLANWWYDDGRAWYFFKDGKKLTGYGKDNSGTKYFVNGKYATGVYGGKTYKEGLEVNKGITRGYHNNLYYVNGKLANWWYDDGRAWYFFKDGKKLTGYGRDNSGTKYFVNGKYATGVYGGKTYKEGLEVRNTVTTNKVSSSPSNKGNKIYQAALAQLGKKQDCTMLVTNALKSVGINFHDWPAGYKKLGTIIPASHAKPGDLIYYPNGGLGLAHIAVYAGNGQAVHGGWNGNSTVLNTADVGYGAQYIRVK